MKTYTVKVPLVGYTYVEVEAENEDEALELAIQEADGDAPEELYPVHAVVAGNVCYAPCIEAHVTDVTTDTTLSGESAE